MIIGLLAGIFWALDTVILSMGLSVLSGLMIPLVFTACHDFFSSILLLGYRNKKTLDTIRCLKTRKGKYLILSSILGGPIGMSAYVMAISCISASYSAMISSIFPAFGVFFASIFLKERMNTRQRMGLILSLMGVCLLGYTKNQTVDHWFLGIVCALICCVCWALEGVISGAAMKDSDIDYEMALQIRQTVSFLFYGVIVMNVLHLWSYLNLSIFVYCIILGASVFGTASYLCYYKAISNIGVSKAMPLDITYGAWALVFNGLFFQIMPSLKDGICGIIILIGSIVAGI